MFMRQISPDTALIPRPDRWGTAGIEDVPDTRRVYDGAAIPAVIASTQCARLWLLATVTLLLAACGHAASDRLAIRDWEPWVKVSADSEVTVKSHSDEVKVFYRKEF